ncbi:Hypothetical predicted protein [Olea europaea subsp. europaea]|uniref:Uncharacterized protein n=1 Tax=Olea europaea subsp. europaea TaxID=158383 RepID=A0A8S0QYW3_OLEEU|nr:Hypothetical predicted protein [Olea europaea subsp. europaea]
MEMEGIQIVKVVRSDVIVDGVSDLKESDLGSGEVVDLRDTPDNRNEAATQDFREVTNASTEGTENKAEEIEGKETALRGPRQTTEKVEVKRKKS